MVKTNSTCKWIGVAVAFGFVFVLLWVLVSFFVLVHGANDRHSGSGLTVIGKVHSKTNNEANKLERVIMISNSSSIL